MGEVSLLNFFLTSFAEGQEDPTEEAAWEDALEEEETIEVAASPPPPYHPPGGRLPQADRPPGGLQAAR